MYHSFLMILWAHSLWLLVLWRNTRDGSKHEELEVLDTHFLREKWKLRLLFPILHWDSFCSGPTSFMHQNASEAITKSKLNHAVEDLGFPRWWTWTPEGRPTYYSAKAFHQYKQNWVQGAWIPTTSLSPPMKRHLEFFARTQQNNNQLPKKLIRWL